MDTTQGFDSRERERKVSEWREWMNEELLRRWRSDAEEEKATFKLLFFRWKCCSRSLDKVAPDSLTSPHHTFCIPYNDFLSYDSIALRLLLRYVTSCYFLKNKFCQPISSKRKRSLLPFKGVWAVYSRCLPVLFFFISLVSSLVFRLFFKVILWEDWIREIHESKKDRTDTRVMYAPSILFHDSFCHFQGLFSSGCHEKERRKEKINRSIELSCFSCCRVNDEKTMKREEREREKLLKCFYHDIPSETSSCWSRDKPGCMSC